MILRPPAARRADVEVPRAELRTASNGVPIHVLSSDDFGVLRVTFVFRAGSSVQEHPFCASATANMLAEGSPGCPAQEIAERLDFYGSWFDVNIDRDCAYISFCTLSKFVARTLDVAADILIRPAFPEAEFAAYRAKRRQQLAIERTKVDVKAREAFARALFGAGHPYGRSFDECGYDRLTRDELVAFYRRWYRAENCFVVCSGRVGDAEYREIEALVGRLPRGGSRPEVDLPDPVTTHELFVEHPGAVQSALRVGRLLFTREHPDFVGMQVVACALGGYFGSRLMRSLREERGYTYGVVSAMVNFDRAGYFAVATQVGAEVRDDALRQIDAEIARLREEPMPDEELGLVKTIMEGEMLRILDGPFGIADVTIENLLCGRDNGFVEEQAACIRAVTPAEVQQLARRYLAPEELVKVVVGAR